MPVMFKQPNTGLTELVRTLISAPALIRKGRAQARQLTRDRQASAASLQKSIAEASKADNEAQILQDQFSARQNLAPSLNTLRAFREGGTIPTGSLGPGVSPLEGDINSSLRSNQDLFGPNVTPSSGDASSALATVLRGFGGNSKQVTGAILNDQTAGLRSEAADAARGDQDNELVATLNSVASGNTTPAVFDTNSQGTVLNRFTGQLDESGQLAQANIENTGRTSQDAKFAALQKLNTTLAEEGLPTMPESIMRAAAAGNIEVRQDPVGLQSVIFDPVQQRVLGTVDPKQGFTPFQAPPPEPESDEGGGIMSLIQGLFSGGDQTQPQPGGGAGGGGTAAGPGQPPFAGAMWSPVRQEWVSPQDLEFTAQQRGLSVEQVKQQLGIQ